MAEAGTSMEIVEIAKTKERDDEIVKLFKIADIIIEELGPTASAEIGGNLSKSLIDIDLSDEIAGVLMTVFTCLRKEENDTAGHNRYKAYTATISGITVSVQSIIERIKKLKIELNFLVATPIVEIMTLFKAFFDEVRTGVTRFKVRASVAKRAVKRDAQGNLVTTQGKDKDPTQSISQYGLINHHIPLLQGITLAPERRTGVIRSLGPMTQAILLVMEDKYHTKLTSALTNSLQMLPMCQEVVNCLKEARTPGQVAGILKELGDILLMTTARSTQKLYLPLLLLRYMWLIKPNEFKWSFSGTAMIQFYSTVVQQNVTFKMKSGADTLKTSEVVFHAMFGTYLEDLSVLSQITSAPKWHQRKDLNSVFHKRASQPAIQFKGIHFKYVSKMAQSLLTKSLGNVDPVATSRPSFSGVRKRVFTQEFLTYLQTGKASHSFSSDPLQLQFALKKTKDTLIEEKDSERMLMAGTTAWESMSSRGWTTTDFIPLEGNIKFYGTNS